MDNKIDVGFFCTSHHFHVPLIFVVFDLWRRAQHWRPSVPKILGTCETSDWGYIPILIMFDPQSSNIGNLNQK